jgi:hypothetical protein
MNSILKQLNFHPPTLGPWDNGEGVEVTWADEKSLSFKVMGSQWMYLNLETYHEVFEFFSHYDQAKGHCICTGLGFGLREKWLLNNKKVTKLTVIEKNPEVISYHEKIKSDVFLNAEIINEDANGYSGSCDTLLLDHFEFEPWNNPPKLFIDVKQCSTNIEHEVMWFWPLEHILVYYARVYKYCDLSPAHFYKGFRESYPTLPDLTDEKLLQYCKMFCERDYIDAG